MHSYYNRGVLDGGETEVQVFYKRGNKLTGDKEEFYCSLSNDCRLNVIDGKAFITKKDCTLDFWSRQIHSAIDNGEFNPKEILVALKEYYRLSHA